MTHIGSTANPATQFTKKHWNMNLNVMVDFPSRNLHYNKYVYYLKFNKLKARH